MWPLSVCCKHVCNNAVRPQYPSLSGHPGKHIVNEHIISGSQWPAFAVSRAATFGSLPSEVGSESKWVRGSSKGSPNGVRVQSVKGRGSRSSSLWLLRDSPL